MITYSPEDKRNLEEFKSHLDEALLFGTGPFMNLPPAPPRYEYWQRQRPELVPGTGSAGQEMVAILGDDVYHVGDYYKPEQHPFAKRDEVLLIRRCTSFDF